jgi:prefoldin subunit 5
VLKQTIGLLFCIFLLPGCIVNDIYDQLESANGKLERVEVALAEIERTNSELAQLQVRLVTLEKIQSIDTSLASIEGQLGPISEDLTKLDGHLASLRKTISNIDSTIPFLKLSGDDEEGDEAGDEDAETPPTEPTSASEDGNSVEDGNK